MDNWPSEYIFHFLKSSHWSDISQRNEEGKFKRIKSCIAFIIKKKKNHLGRKLTTIKFWKVTSTLENLRSLEKCDTPRTIFFLTLPWEWSRKCAGGKDEVYNTLPTFSHVFPGENTDYKSFWGEKSSTMVYPVVPCVRATSCIVTVLLSVDERSCLLPNISIIVIRNFRIQTVVKRDHRDSNHNSRDYDN